MSGSYHVVVWRRALAQAVSDVLGKSTNERLVRFLAFGITFVIAWVVYTSVRPNAEELSALQIATTITAAALVAAFVFVLVINLLWAVPAALYREQGGQIAELTRWRTPSLTAEVLNEGQPHALGIFHAQINAGGDVHVNMAGENRTICLLVRNTSAVQAETVQAQLVEFSGDNGNSIRDSIALHWAQAEPGQYWTHIGAGGGLGTLKLFKETARGALILVGQVPPEHLTLIHGGKIFSGRIVLTEEHHGAFQVQFVLNAAEKRLTITGMGPAVV